MIARTKYVLLSLALMLMPALAPTSGAQAFSVGVKGGAVVQDAADGGPYRFWRYVPESKHYTFGPSVEVPIYGRLSIEVDALYRRVGLSQYGSVFPEFAATEREKVRANSWELPLLLKYLLRDSGAAPFVAGGIGFQYLAGRRASLSAGPGFEYPRDPSLFIRRTGTWGFVLEGGVRTKVMGIGVAPRVRYTRWNIDLFQEVGQGVVRSNRNQIQLLVGLMWGR